jgi:hypothetical protein
MDVRLNNLKQDFTKIVDIKNENIKTFVTLSDKIKIHNISRHYPENVNVTNPDYFDELCKNIFTLQDKDSTSWEDSG